MNEATKPLTFLPARLHLWRASDGASTHVIQARDAATQDWFIIFLFVYIFFGTSATRLPGGWDAETLAYGVTPHAFCKEVHLQSWIPASHYTDPYRLSGRSRDYFLMPARMTRLSCCRFKKPTFLLTLHPKNQMCTRGGKMVLFGVYLLLISLGSYKGRGGEARRGGVTNLLLSKRERIDASSFDVSSCSEWGESRAPRACWTEAFVSGISEEF